MTEGDCFTVPLDAAGEALGVVARAKKDAILVYFFVPSRPLSELRASNAQLVALTGLVGFQFGWRPAGRLPNFSRAAWPRPDARRGTLAVQYDDLDPTREIGVRPLSAEEVRTLPLDGSWGDKAVVRKLSLLAQSATA